MNEVLDREEPFLHAGFLPWPAFLNMLPQLQMPLTRSMACPQGQQSTNQMAGPRLVGAKEEEIAYVYCPYIIFKCQVCLYFLVHDILYYSSNMHAI